MPQSVELRTGRLIEIICEGKLNPDEVQQLRTKCWLKLSSLDARALIYADLRGVPVGVDIDESKTLQTFMVDNFKVERSAIVLGEALRRQMERLVAAARPSDKPSTNRRIFYSPREAVAWLREVATTPGETARLDELARK